MVKHKQTRTKKKPKRGYKIIVRQFKHGDKRPASGESLLVAYAEYIEIRRSK